jgi:ketosteroid isomerase-like protein
MRTRIAAVAALCLGFGTCGAAAEPANPLADMVRTEFEFAAAAARDGVKPAFLQYLAEDSITFGPAPTNAHQLTASSPDRKGTIEWYPEFALVSSAGDLGLSTGPATFKTEGQPDRYGHFCSVWRKQPNGKWRAVFDSGIGHGAQSPKPEPLDPARLQFAAATTPAGVDEASLRAADKAYSLAAATSGFSAAIRHVAHKDVRVYRNGSAPIIGVRPAAAVLRAAAALGEWRTDFAAVSGDFGYTYGQVQETGKDAKPRAGDAYLRIWQHVEGRWQLVLDLVSEIPEES